MKLTNSLIVLLALIASILTVSASSAQEPYDYLVAPLKKTLIVTNTPPMRTILVEPRSMRPLGDNKLNSQSVMFAIGDTLKQKLVTPKATPKKTLVEDKKKKMKSFGLKSDDHLNIFDGMKIANEPFLKNKDVLPQKLTPKAPPKKISVVKKPKYLEDSLVETVAQPKVKKFFASIPTPARPPRVTLKKVLDRSPKNAPVKVQVGTKPLKMKPLSDLYHDRSRPRPRRIVIDREVRVPRRESSRRSEAQASQVFSDRVYYRCRGSHCRW